MYSITNLPFALVINNNLSISMWGEKEENSTSGSQNILFKSKNFKQNVQCEYISCLFLKQMTC